MEEKMKSKILSFILFLGISCLFPAYTTQSNDKSDEARLNNVDAVQAIAIANEWNYSKKEITSYVTPREVVFKSSDDKVTKMEMFWSMKLSSPCETVFLNSGFQETVRSH
jgi:hypothetical protein